MNKSFDRFFLGYELEAYKLFGCHKKDQGVEFCVYAPHAHRVEVFSSRDDFKVFYPLEKVDARGIWYLFLDNTKPIYSYRYRIYNNKNEFMDKSDPYGYYFERRPANATVMYDLDYFSFTDDEYMRNRNFSYENPLNIYEVHPNGFKKEGELSSYQELKEELIPYVKKMGYTHIELMPINEYPFDGSWGYQATGFYGATSRYGTPYDLMDFINECHLNNIGVILDVVYVHFAVDDYGLKNFDFSPLYEGNTQKSQWGTYLFNLNSSPVVSFLMSSANFYLSTYHFDGLRFDAVSNLVFKEGNKNLGEYKDGISFLKRTTSNLKKLHPDIMLIAEDSTDYPHVTVPIEYKGLGFDYKWDLGWMNDTLRYYEMDPEYRQYHHNLLTFSMAYFFSEKFLLPLSHDEVVHSKRTIIDKMWGTYEEKFSQCRTLFLYMFTHPGKKLNFMGNDMAMFREFDETKELDWFILKYPIHDSFNRFFRDLCQIYLSYKAFYSYDYINESFKWIDPNNYKQGVYSFCRYDEDYCFVIIMNNKPISYKDYRLGVPYAGEYVELINSEKDIYSGCNMCNFKPIKTKRIKAHGLNNSLTFDLAPYGSIIFMIDISRKKPTIERRNKIPKELEICSASACKQNTK